LSIVFVLQYLSLMDLILLLFARMASAPKVTALAVNMVMAMTSDAGTPAPTGPAVAVAAAGIVTATARNAKIFNVYIFVLIGTALVLAFFTWLVWDAGNKVQDAIRADADARILEAQNKGLSLEADLNTEKGKVAGLQKDASDAKTAQQRVETKLAEQQTRAAIAERSLLELQEKVKPRHLTPEQKAAIKVALEGWPPHEVRITAFVGTPDGTSFGIELAAAINDGGWTASFLGQESSGGELRGIALIMKDTNHPTPGAKHLQDALSAAGLPAPAWNNPQWGAPESVISMLVAPK
jgi:hypothetical protein